MSATPRSGAAPWFDRLIWKAPWLTLASLGAGVLPGYAWWLATGDAARARQVVRLALPCSLAALVALLGVLAFCLPFLGAHAAPSRAERLGSAAFGGALWQVAALLALLAASDLSLLAAARLGTAVFAAGFVAGLALQRHIMRGGDGIGTGK